MIEERDLLHQTPSTPPEPPLNHDEIVARVGVHRWLAAQGKLAAAQLQLEQAANTDFHLVSAVELIDAYEDAEKEADSATRALGHGGVDKKADRALIERVLTKHQQQGQRESQRTYDFRAMSDAQQAAERRRTELETAQAAAERAPTEAPYPAPRYQEASEIPDAIRKTWGLDKDDDDEPAHKSEHKPVAKPATKPAEKPAEKPAPKVVENPLAWPPLKPEGEK